jgi:hypothetical protein
VSSWTQDLTILNFLDRCGRLFTIDLGDQRRVDVKAFCEFLEVPVSEPILQRAALWPKVNTAAKDAASAARLAGQIDSPTKAELIAQYRIIPEMERHYTALLKR